jgi:hypothetical protein
VATEIGPPAVGGRVTPLAASTVFTACEITTGFTAFAGWKLTTPGAGGLGSSTRIVIWTVSPGASGTEGVFIGETCEDC